MILRGVQWFTGVSYFTGVLKRHSVILSSSLSFSRYVLEKFYFVKCSVDSHFEFWKCGCLHYIKGTIIKFMEKLSSRQDPKLLTSIVVNITSLMR